MGPPDHLGTIWGYLVPSFACLSVCLSFCLSVCLFVCLLVCLSACLPICLSVFLSVCVIVSVYISSACVIEVRMGSLYTLCVGVWRLHIDLCSQCYAMRQQ